MRFVKINTAEIKSKMCNRNCIASAKSKIAAKVDRCTEITKNLDIKEKAFKIKNNLFIKLKNITEKVASAAKSIDLKEKINVVAAKADLKERSKKIIVYLKNNVSRKTAVTVAASASAFVLVIVLNMNFSFAYNAFMGDKQLGFVRNKEIINNCISGINTEFAQYVSGENIVGDNVIYVPAIIRKSGYTDEFTLCENIKSTSDVMVKSYAVEVDGVAFAALSQQNEAESILNKITDSYKTDENTVISFKEDVQVVYEYVPAVIVMDSASAFEKLSGSATFYNTVKVDGNITVEDFASNNGLDIEYLRSLNPELGDTLTAQSEVVVPEWKPVITVLTVDTVSYEKSVPFEEQVIKDSTIYEGNDKIIKAGEEGKSAVTEQIYRANGAVVNQTVISSQVVSAPVTQMRAVGTKERPAHVGTGSFIRPYGGYISSRFGSRSLGNHKGIDICGTVGDDLFAADNGTVVYSGWMSGYGYLIQIDHNNGYVTYYGHCSELYAKVGDVVAKGDVIAALGNTGRSTGPHVHFEVRYNGEIHNPLNYIG